MAIVLWLKVFNEVLVIDYSGVVGAFEAERFGKKLGELCRERGALKLGLPSRQPGVAAFLQRLTQAVNSALQRTQRCQRRWVNHSLKGNYLCFVANACLLRIVNRVHGILTIF